MRETVLIILSSLWLLNCTNSGYDVGKDTAGKSYDIEINYTDNSDFTGRKNSDKLISPDSLYIFAEGNFQNNLLSVYLNGELAVKDTIFTNEIIGLAEHYSFGLMDEIRSFGIRVDNGKLLLIEPVKEQNIWRIRYNQNELLQAIYFKHAPYYD